jgi:hypothetical protein
MRLEARMNSAECSLAAGNEDMKLAQISGSGARISTTSPSTPWLSPSTTLLDMPNSGSNSHGLDTTRRITSFRLVCL